MQSRGDRRRNPHAGDRTFGFAPAKRGVASGRARRNRSLGLRWRLFSGLLAEVEDKEVDRVDVVYVR